MDVGKFDYRRDHCLWCYYHRSVYNDLYRSSYVGLEGSDALMPDIWESVRGWNFSQEQDSEDRLWCCPKGHEIGQKAPFWIAAHKILFNNETVTFTWSGPVCQVCFCEAIGEQFPIHLKE